MAKASTKKVSKTAPKAKTAAKPVGIKDANDAKRLIGEFNKMIKAFAAENGVTVAKNGTALFNRSRGVLTLPSYKFTSPMPKIEKGVRVAAVPTGSDEASEGVVTKVEGKIAFVLFDGDKKPQRHPISKLKYVASAAEAKRKKVLPVLGQGVEVVPDREYEVKGGGSAMLSKQREGRVSMWTIEVNKGKGQGWSRYGSYGRTVGKEGDVNRRFAEFQLRKIVAGVKGAKKSNPDA